MPPTSLRDVETQQFLKFTLPDSTSVMVRSNHLTEVLSLNLQQVVSISDVNPALIGVYNWRGEVLWLLDLGAYLGSDPLYKTSFRLGKLNVVIVHFDGQTLGLCVDQVNEMIRCDVSEIQPPPTHDLHSMLQACTEGYFLDSEKKISWVLNAQTLLEKLA